MKDVTKNTFVGELKEVQDVAFFALSNIVADMLNKCKTKIEVAELASAMRKRLETVHDQFFQNDEIS